MSAEEGFPKDGSSAPPAARASRRRVLAIGAGLVVLGVGSGTLGALVGGSTPTAPTTAPRLTAARSVPSAAAAPSSAPAFCHVTAVAAKDLPSVVTIEVRGASSSSTGSGEVIRANGYILTNNHVIASAVKGGSIAVLFDSGNIVPARLVGRDPLADLAVVKVTTPKPLRPIPIGSSAALRVGEPVVALGAPLGLSSTVTAGIVSALDRTISVPGEGSTHAVLIDAIQTDAAINPGNSGGSLVNCAGRLVGIPSAGATIPSASGQPASEGDIGLGFAIPIDMAKTVANELIATGKVTHAYLGLDAEPLSPGTGATTPGLYVTAVSPGGPAAKAGIRSGDVVTKIDGATATSTDQLVELSLRHKPGQKVTLQVERSNKRFSATVLLGKEP